jgi:hypothetical protein
MNGLLKAQEDNLLQYILDEIHQMIKRLPRSAIAALGVTRTRHNVEKKSLFEALLVGVAPAKSGCG